MVLKTTEQIIRENAFGKKNQTRVKFNPGLSTNLPSNNWALKCKGGFDNAGSSTALCTL